jgi:hypothetical protein
LIEQVQEDIKQGASLKGSPVAALKHQQRTKLNIERNKIME